MVFALLAGSFLFACTSPRPADPTASSGPSVTRTGQLTPFIYRTATLPPTATQPSPPTAQPTPTATPQTHTVLKGEDMGGIAYRYRVSLADLLAANPTVQPRMLSVGTVLVIPTSGTPQPQLTSTSAAADPTPIPLAAGPVGCTQALDGGVWCFLTIQNRQEFAVEAITAQIQITDSQGKTAEPRMAFLPLDVLAPGKTLPLSAYLPPNLATSLRPPFQATSELRTAFHSPADGRYLPTHIEKPIVTVSENGRSARVSLTVFLEPENIPARRVWVAATAYDQTGSVVGVRRWEYPGDQPLAGGQALPVNLSIYSVGSPIERVEFEAEARP